jgi:acyl-CoA thioester hydrolase
MSDPIYSQTYAVKWSDLDPNGHLRHSVYGDYAVDVRIRFLAEHGFPPARFQELKFGPVIMEEHNRFLREVRMGETISVNAQLAGASADGSRWIIQHEVYKPNGKKAAVLRVEGSWIDLDTRRLIAPPPDLSRLFAEMSRTLEYVEIP